MYEYTSTITAVHDGDTVTMDTVLRVIAKITAQDLGFHVSVAETQIIIPIQVRDMKLRLAGINADELITATGKAARDWLSALILNQSLLCRTTRMSGNNVWDAQEKYGRYLATLFLPDGTSVNQKMVDAGYAVSKKYGVAA